MSQTWWSRVIPCAAVWPSFLNSTQPMTSSAVQAWHHSDDQWWTRCQVPGPVCIMVTIAPLTGLSLVLTPEVGRRACPHVSSPHLNPVSQVTNNFQKCLCFVIHIERAKEKNSLIYYSKTLSFLSFVLLLKKPWERWQNFEMTLKGNFHKIKECQNWERY